MIRLTVLLVALAFLAVYAWKDWHTSLCGLIALMAIVEHPDMPKSMLGIQGLNPWNLLLLVVVLAWFTDRRREAPSWDMPPLVSALLVLYLGVVLLGFARMVLDLRGVEAAGVGYLVSEYLINTVKWVIPGLLLFDGCRSRPRLLAGLACLLAVYLFLSLQVIRWMPPGAVLSGADLARRSLKILANEVGYHRVNLSMMLAGASWAIVATVPLASRRIHRLLILTASLVVVYGQALTAGRMGYVTWAILGLVLCVIRWRRYLALVPLVLLLVPLAIPGAAERMLEGFSPETRDSNALLPADDGLGSTDDDSDAYTITAGRNVAWSYVVTKIGESPLVGFGRLAMQRTGIARHLWEEFRENFPHPHNAYLEILLDSGGLGFLVVVGFYLIVVARGAACFRDPSPLVSAVGGVACSLVLALLIASFGSQSFYPREGSVGMWCAIGLLLRVWVQPGLASGVTEAPAPVTAWWQAPGVAPPASHAAPGGRPWWQRS